MRVGGSREPLIAQQVARVTGASYSAARDVLVRLVAAGVLSPQPRLNERAPLPYAIVEGDLWHALRDVALVVSHSDGHDPVSRFTPATGGR